MRTSRQGPLPRRRASAIGLTSSSGASGSGEHFVDFSITEFEVVCSNRYGHAVLLGRRSDGWPYVVNPWARNQAADMSWGRQDIAEPQPNQFLKKSGDLAGS